MKFKTCRPINILFTDASMYAEIIKKNGTINAKLRRVVFGGGVLRNDQGGSRAGAPRALVMLVTF